MLDFGRSALDYSERMYTPSILATPLVSSSPINSERPNEARTFDWPFLDGDVQIGIWECTPGKFGDATTDFDEAMFMVSGRATIDHVDGHYDIAPGTLWTTPRHWPNTWHVHQTIRKIYIIDNRPGSPGVPTHLPNAYTVDCGVSSPRPAAIAGDPRESSITLWSHNALDIGVWECTPGEFSFTRMGYSEVLTVLSGRATLHIDGGPSFELVPGAMILTPSGTNGRWTIHETVRKVYYSVND